LIRERLENGERRFAISQKDLEHLVALAERALDPAMVLVPREPTEAMIEAGVRDRKSYQGVVLPAVERIRSIYTAMINAAGAPDAD
jgi:hypothetical protein